jgi:hypothetical protein
MSTSSRRRPKPMDATDQYLHPARLFLRLMRLRGPPTKDDQAVALLKAILLHLGGRDGLPRESDA